MALSHYTRFCTLVLIGLLLASCGATGPVNETWALVQLMTKGEKVDVVTEVIEVRNCGATERKTVTCSAGTANELDVSLGGGISLGEGFSGQIDGSISTGLGLGRDSGESLTLDVPAEGTISLYTVNKEFRVVSGKVLARSSNGNEREAGYTFHASCSLRIANLETLICPDTGTPKPTIVPTPTTATTAGGKGCSVPLPMVAVAVGVTDETAFSRSDSMHYSVTAYVDNVDEAILELNECFGANDVLYVVHVPDLTVTPGNPGACKLHLNQVNRLRDFPPGWLVGGGNMIPDQFRDGLYFCFE